jgi:Zn-dependent protease
LLDNFDLARTLKYLPGIVLGLTLHEFSHAYIAHLCGDSTSRDQGRVTLNPLKHIDMLGFIMLLVAGFGWAKPVQFREENLRNPKTDVIKIALAGPLSNALIAMILSVVFSLLVSFVPIYSNHAIGITYEVIHYAIYINWGLFVFNLIPLPPLDGSHLLLHQFKRFPAVYSALYRYGSIVLFALIIGSAFTKIDLLPIWPVIRFLGEGFLSLVGYR